MPASAHNDSSSITLRAGDGVCKKIGPGERVFLIAEAGVNHDGDVDAALEMIDAAAQAGADAVKFQTFTAEELTTAKVGQAEYQRESGRMTQQEMLKRLELPRDAYPRLWERCQERRILFLSTPFDIDSARFLVDMGMPGIKVSSGELTNLPFLAELASMRLPMILSTGMGCIDEVQAAVDVVRKSGSAPFALLHCTSNYPTLPEDVNLRAMRTLADRFDVPVGYSDHTMGLHAAAAATALGARIIEKHFTLSHERSGPDHAASLEPRALAALVRVVRETELMLGSGDKIPATSERPVQSVARRYLCAVRDLEAGHVLTDADLSIKRCRGSVPPGELPVVVGKSLKRSLRAEEPLRAGDW